MEFTAIQIATFLNGEVFGDPNVVVNDVSKIEEGKPGTLTFLSNPKYTPYLYETQASVVLVNRSFEPTQNVQPTLIKVDDSYKALALLLDLYVQSQPVKTGIEQPSFIAPSAKLGEQIYVGAFAYIDEQTTIGNGAKIYPQAWIGRNVKIGENTIIFAGVKIYPDTKIGSNCIIHAGTVIGSDGFGFAPQPDGTFKKIHQIGNVVIEDNVEIGANTAIDCATMGSTIIRKGVKLDNLIQIAHNVEIGENSVIAALSGVAGSATVGKNCMFAGQVGIAGHLKVGNHVTLAAKTGVTGNIADGETHMGTYSFDVATYRKAHVIFRNLPELSKEIHRIKKQLEQKD
jgi:UDP-3-O-[3-hydroxymyristoyl] glucosamine N-acyltransferase